MKVVERLHGSIREEDNPDIILEIRCYTLANEIRRRKKK